MASDTKESLTDVFMKPSFGSLPSHNQAVIVGIYGLPGAGKTHTLKYLKSLIGEDQFAYFEGSEVINTTCPGGLEVFKKMPEGEKLVHRQRAITKIKETSLAENKAAVVTGHFMFWPEEEDTPNAVYTQDDLDIFTHIVYLEYPAEDIWMQQRNDMSRDRPATSIQHLKRWQQAEVSQMREVCLLNKILLVILRSRETALSKIVLLLKDFRDHSKTCNLERSLSFLDDALCSQKSALQRALILDGDKTLIEEDTGHLLFRTISRMPAAIDRESPLKRLFSSRFGYSYEAFRQATLLHEEEAESIYFRQVCEVVASSVTFRPQFKQLLNLVSEQKHIKTLIVTCGLRTVWQKIVENEGLSNAVTVVGGGRITDGFVVTADVKAALVTHLKQRYKLDVWVFGDSMLDLPMMKAADNAIVVVGEEETRSKSMENALERAITKENLRASQTVFAKDSKPRLNAEMLPLVHLTDLAFQANLITPLRQGAKLKVTHATNSAGAKMLMTPCRNSEMHGPKLRKAHGRVGWYLAVKYLGEIIGLEEYGIPHVQGGTVAGFKLRQEMSTMIIALMRGGEPMAVGVNDAFPDAMFVHARHPEEIKPELLKDVQTIILVDSVVNTGASVKKFVQGLHGLQESIQIIVVAQVVQAGAIGPASPLQSLAAQTDLHVVALRLSDNKFTGSKGTDTGNRLFNTTQLD